MHFPIEDASGIRRRIAEALDAAWRHVEEKDMARAAAIARSMKVDFVCDDDTLCRIGHILFRCADTDGAEACFLDALSQNRDCLQSYLLLQEIEIARRDRARDKRDVTGWIRKGFDNARDDRVRDIFLGHLLYYGKEFSESVRVFRRADAHNAIDSVRGVFAFSLIYDRQYSEGIGILERLPEGMMELKSWKLLAYAHFCAGNYLRAMAIAKPYASQDDEFMKDIYSRAIGRHIRSSLKRFFDWARRK